MGGNEIRKGVTETMTNVDPQLFERAARGDRDAYWRLIGSYRGLIYSVARGMLRDHEQAEDQLHEVLLTAFRSLPSLRKPDRLPSWLYSLTRNHIMDRMRRERRIREAASVQAAEQAFQVVSVAEMGEREAWMVRMEQAMNRLPEPFRIILAMKYMNNFSCREIAEVLEISVSATKSRLFEARKLLRKMTEQIAKDEDREADHALR